MRERRKRAARWALGLATLVLVTGVAFWAGRVTTELPETVDQVPADQATVAVVEQELGRVITLTTTATRPSAPLALNALSGTVTQVSDSGEFDQGEVLYAVGDIPVVLVRGEVPFWRDLEEGTEGPDVEQVQQLLADAGADVSVDGEWVETTTTAAREWQAEQGYPVTGTFPKGTLVASPTTPVAISLDAEAAWVGGELSGGEPIVSVAGGDPSFAMEVTQPQAELLPPGTEVTVQGGTAAWSGVISESRTTSEGNFLLPVTAPDGSLLCGQECGELAPDTTSLLTEAALVPPITGPVVPVAALTTEPDGTTTVGVVTADGFDSTPVEVLTVADGLAVVEGVEAGQVVRVFGGEADTPGGSPPQPEPPEDTPPGDDDTTTAP